MAESPRFTVRLPEPLAAVVQEHIRTTGTPFAILVREALSAYCADTAPTGTPTGADTADTVRMLQVQLAAVTIRLEEIESTLARVRQRADTPADTTSTAADRPPTPADRPADRGADRAPTGPRRRSRPGTMRARILALLREHPEGLTAEEIRFYLKPQKPLGDTLQGMVRQGLLTRDNNRKGGRYLAIR
jgi:hypothetical protein